MAATAISNQSANSESGKVLPIKDSSALSRMTYRVTVLGLTILLLLTAALAVVASRFQPIAELKLILPVADREENIAAQQAILAELKELTTDPWLAELQRRAGRTTAKDQGWSDASEPTTSPMTPVELRRALSFSMRRQGESETMKLEVRFAADHRAFGRLWLQVFCDELQQRLTSQGFFGDRLQNLTQPATAELTSTIQMERERARLLIARLKSEIERIQAVEVATAEHNSTEFAAPSTESKPLHFHSASFSRPVDQSPQLNQIVGDLAGTAAQIEECFSNLIRPAQSKPQPDVKQSNEVPTGLASVRMVPVGLLASRHYLLVALLLSFAAATAIAVRLPIPAAEAALARRRSVEKSSGAPVLAVISGLAGLRSPEKTEWPARILKLSEMFLLGTFVMVAMLSLLRAEFRETLFANPMQAMCQLIWALRGW